MSDYVSVTVEISFDGSVSKSDYMLTCNESSNVDRLADALGYALRAQESFIGGHLGEVLAHLIHEQDMCRINSHADADCDKAWETLAFSAVQYISRVKERRTALAAIGTNVQE